LQVGLFGEKRSHGVVVQRLGEARRAEFECLEQGSGLGYSIVDVLADVLVGVQFGFLGQEADLQALLGNGLSEELGLDPGEDAHQRALARTVGTDDPDLGAGEERQPGLAEDLFAAGCDPAQTLEGVDELGHEGFFGATKGVRSGRVRGAVPGEWAREGSRGSTFRGDGLRGWGGFGVRFSDRVA